MPAKPTTPDERTLPDFLEALGSSAPTPGGGAASALAGALAAALAEMVAQLTVGRPRFQAVELPMRALIERARQARADLLALADEDEHVYQRVSAAYRLPKATDEERTRREAAIQDGLRQAMQPPLGMMQRGCDVLTLAYDAATAGNPAVASDAGCAAVLAEASVRAAGLNVLANVVLLRDAAAVQEARARVAELEAEAAALHEQTITLVRERMGA